MKKLFLVLIISGSAALFNLSGAQIRKVPAEVTEAFKAKYPDTKNVEWKDKVSSFQANYEMAGENYESKFNSKGEWLQTEKDIDEASLPAEVKDGFSKSKFTEWELKSASWVESRDHGVQYRVLVRKNSVEKKYLYFDKTGRLVKEAITI